MPKNRKTSSQKQIEAFCCAAANSGLNEMRALAAEGVDVNGVDKTGFTALASASRLGATRSVELLIELGADIDLPSWQDLTPLMFACDEGKVKGSKIAIRLIEAGADVNYVRKSDEMTALKFAAREAKPEVIQMLIDHGAEVDGPPKTEQTALMLAARAGNVENLKVLVKNGADTNRLCKLPWAKTLNALGLAELEKRKKAVEYLRTVTKKSR